MNQPASSSSKTAQPTAALTAPVAPGERYEIIDIIRGFALFGVLLANMVWTTQDLALPEEQREAMSTKTIDDAAQYFVGTFIDGKFYTLFSMLFGLGFAVQLMRASDRGVSVLPSYTRRLGILFLMGALHAVLLWFGDVLHVYALLGFVLILFAGRSDRTVLTWTIVFAALAISTPILHAIVASLDWEYPRLFGHELTEAESFEALANGGYADVVALNWSVQLDDYGEIGFIGGMIYWYLSVLWKFLLGFFIGRRLLLQHAEKHLTFFRRLLPWALMFGLVVSLYTTSIWVYDAPRPENRILRGMLRSTNEIAVFALSMSYLCTLVLLSQRETPRKVIRWLAPVGRMALTNYLTHSVCIVLLFYGIGLGLLGKAGTAACILFSVIIFGLQIPLSVWWLKRFRFGPMEWGWRCLTYGRMQPFRVKR